MNLINEREIYILNQPPTTIHELVERLLPMVPTSIHWIVWSSKARKLWFCQELPNGGAPTGLYYEMGMVNENLTEWEEDFIYEVKFPRRLSIETQSQVECFEKPDGPHYFFMDALNNGGFVVHSKEDPSDVKVIQYGWEVPK